jgi:4-hydroxybenzoate polyprenyltransferase
MEARKQNIASVILESLRPGQWVKNLLVMSGFFFALGDRTHTLDLKAVFLKTVFAFVLFCMISSSVYLMNDLHDAEKDRIHPLKRNRPIASGRLSGRLAVLIYLCFLAVSLGGSMLLGIPFALNISAYFLLQAFYTHWFKNIVIGDLIAVAVGFVLRVYAGTLAAGIYTSPWLLICTFMAALFVIICKRREEKALLGDKAATHRPVLSQYSLPMLDHCISMMSGATIVCYAIYAPAVVPGERFRAELMVLTVPFVIFGVLRYMYLVMCRGQGGSPEKILTGDLPTVINIACYLIVYFFAMILS